MKNNEINNKRCDELLDEYLMLDKNEHIPMHITMHLFMCKKCRTQVHYLNLAEKLVAKPLKITTPISESKVDSLLRPIFPKWEEKPVSMTKWVVGGILMVLFMLAFGLSAKAAADERLQTYFYLVFAGVVTSYCALFIGTNMDFFIKKLNSPAPAL